MKTHESWHARVLRIQIRSSFSIAETGERLYDLGAAFPCLGPAFPWSRSLFELSDNEGRWKDHRIGGRRPVFSDVLGRVDHKMSELDGGRGEVSRIPPDPNIL